MNEQELKTELASLRKQINYHNYLYHATDQPEISDYEYDLLFRRLKEIEALHPEWITSDSPSQRVGSVVSERFRKVTHPAIIFSLANGFGPKEVMDWYQRILRIDPRVAATQFILEPKLDGLTVVLTYVNGIFQLGATRGDGTVGEDITDNLRTIRSLPLQIPIQGNLTPPERLVVRGEVFINKDDFEVLNQAMESRGEKTYLNPRNTAAGSLRQLDSNITAQRPLRLFLYQVLECTGSLPQTQAELLTWLQAWGFPVNPRYWLAADIDETIAICEQAGLERHSWPYEADGLVIKINDLSLANGLGFVGKDPRGALAYKYPGQEVETKLIEIRTNVGRTGVLTPLAILEPVNIGGVIVKQATLHNYDFIQEKDIRIGDHVLVKRAGEVIPYIMASLPEKRTGDERVYQAPSHCPSCGSEVEKIAGEVAYYCVNSACPEQLARNLEHFASRSAMDIEGLGSQIVQQLVDAGLVHSSADLYRLKAEDLIELDKFGEKKASNLLSAIENSRKQPLERLLIGLGIRSIGEVNARNIIEHFHSLDALKMASLEELQSIPGVGPNTAQEIKDWFAQHDNLTLIEDFKALGIWPLATPSVDKSNLALSGLSFVITGTLPTLSREQAEALIKDNGGKVSSAVSSKTSYLVLGSQPGSKLVKAEKLRVKIIDESALLAMLA
jgi:DNA ligase (NAD+)